MWVAPMKNLPNLFCHCQTGYFAVAIDTCFELLVPPGAANQMPDWHVIRQLQAGAPQNQDAALFGVSPSTLSKLKAKFHIMGDVKDRPRSARPKKIWQDDMSCHDCPSLSGLFALVSATRTLEPEHVEERYVQ